MVIGNSGFPGRSRDGAGHRHGRSICIKSAAGPQEPAIYDQFTPNWMRLTSAGIYAGFLTEALKSKFIVYKHLGAPAAADAGLTACEEPNNLRSNAMCRRHGPVGSGSLYRNGRNHYS